MSNSPMSASPVSHLPQRTDRPHPGFDGTSALAAAALPGARRPDLQVVSREEPDEQEMPTPPVGFLVRGLLEVLSGLRPASQLALKVSPEIAADLLARPRRRTAARPPQVLRLRVLRVADDVVETCAVLRRGQRCGALAMRLEFGSRGWLVTRLQVG
ncbi:MAG TPA: Rv3235 family protein [Frankiaceae bacterium]|nr:Rv3235 family protein [Frankiaceae bacterium]